MTEFPNADELVAKNAAFATEQHDPALPGQPSRSLAVVTCMDSRIDTLATLGLSSGEAHVIRNAGGVVTDDVIRSLCLSQRYLGTREIILMHHTDCGLAKVDEATLRADLEAETGQRPSWSVEAFDDAYADVRQSIRRLRANPFVQHKDHIRGFVYDVDDGLLHEVETD